VVELLKQLPPERQRAALLVLAEGAAQRRQDRSQYAEAQLRRVAADRGREWDKMPEDEREDFIDDLLHEDRPCGNCPAFVMGWSGTGRPRAGSGRQARSVASRRGWPGTRSGANPGQHGALASHLGVY
jgi:hypothetical protein